MRARYLVWSFAVGCSGAPATKPAAPVAPPPAPPPVVVAPPAPKAPPPITDRTVARPEATACTLPLGAWHGELAFAADAPVFATALAAKTSFLLPQKGTGMFAQIEHGGMRIGAWVHAPTLHLKRSVALSKVVYPRPSAKLDWEGFGRAGAVTVSLDVSSVLVEPAVAREAVECKDLAIEETSYKLASGVPASKGTEVFVNGEAELATSPSAKAVAKLKAAPSGRLFVASKRGASSHLVIDMPDFVVHGWVAASLLEPGLAGGIGIAGAPIYRAAKSTLPNSESSPCVRDLPLFVEHGGQRAEIGVLLAGSAHPKILADADTAGYTAVEPYGEQWLELVPGARLVVRQSDLARCHTK